jgi:radical SAM/Cys-rich protein
MPLTSLAARRVPLSAASVQRTTLNSLPLARDFHASLEPHGEWPLRTRTLETLQINVGKLCNQTCGHCHVDAGPDRREIMTRETMELCLAALDRLDGPMTVDITGGAPELNPHFRWLVEECRARGRHVIDRCNLTVLTLPSQQDLPEWLASHQVEIVCSLPHYRALNTDRQRGAGVYDKSIAALKRLNAVGYGHGSAEQRLVLVTNPAGAFLPGAQVSTETEWKRELWRQHEIRFDALYCLTNMPISRFLEWLIDSGNLESYMARLVAAFNPAAVAGLMCRNMLSVAWDGRLYDCDFNQMLDLPLANSAPGHIRDLDPAALTRRAIAVGPHCFGCTAGAGSSCSGTTVR